MPLCKIYLHLKWTPHTRLLSRFYICHSLAPSLCVSVSVFQFVEFVDSWFLCDILRFANYYCCWVNLSVSMSICCFISLRRVRLVRVSVCLCGGTCWLANWIWSFLICIYCMVRVVINRNRRVQMWRYSCFHWQFRFSFGHWPHIVRMFVHVWAWSFKSRPSFICDRKATSWRRRKKKKNEESYACLYMCLWHEPTSYVGSQRFDVVFFSFFFFLDIVHILGRLGRWTFRTLNESVEMHFDSIPISDRISIY